MTNKGTLAYFDSACGLMPCRIVAAWPGGLSGWQFLAELTASRGVYLRGEVVESSGLSIVPRGAIARRKYGARILAYTWEAGELAEAIEAGRARWHIRTSVERFPAQLFWTVAKRFEPYSYSGAASWRWHAGRNGTRAGAAKLCRDLNAGKARIPAIDGVEPQGARIVAA